MSSTIDLESIALKEKLLNILRKNIPEYIAIDIRPLAFKSENMGYILYKVNKILSTTKINKYLYSEFDWAVAYIIACEQKTLEELIGSYKSRTIIYKQNLKLLNHIKDDIENIDRFIYKIVEKAKEIKNDSIYYIVLDNLEKATSIMSYLVDFINKIKEENKELLETAHTAKENIERTILGIMEKM
jgi:hypothetical protein